MFFPLNKNVSLWWRKRNGSPGLTSLTLPKDYFHFPLPSLSPILTLFLPPKERRGSQIPISHNQDAALCLCIIEIWLLRDSFRPYMGKLRTLVPVHRAGETSPSQVVLGVRASANLMTFKVHEHSQSKKFLWRRYASRIRAVSWAILCPPLTLSPRQELDSSLFNYHLSWLRDLCDAADVAYFSRLQSDGPGSGAAQRSQLSHVTETSPAARLAFLLGSQFRPGVGHCWRSRHCPVVFFVFSEWPQHVLSGLLTDACTEQTSALELSEVKQTWVQVLPFWPRDLGPVQTSRSLFQLNQSNNSACLCLPKVLMR